MCHRYNLRPQLNQPPQVLDLVEEMGDHANDALEAIRKKQEDDERRQKFFDNNIARMNAGSKE